MLIALYNITITTDAIRIGQRDLQKELRWVHNSLKMNFSIQVMNDRLKELEQYSLIDIKNVSVSETNIILKIGLEDIRIGLEDN